MKIQSGNGIAAFPGVFQSSSVRTAAASAAVQREETARRFDQVTITARENGSFEMELKSRLSQEVRSATTTGTLSALKREIEAGTYHPDPASIAKKMLLMQEG